MKTGLTCLFALCLLAVVASAQKRKTFRVNPGQKIVDAIPKADVYFYPDFIDGTVYLKGDNFSNAKLNYNSLFGEMQFINAKGDTLSLADEETISSIVIKTDTFYYDNVYLKLVANYGEVKLANRQYFSFTNRQKIGVFGGLSDGSIETYDAISTGTYLKELVAQEVLTLSKNSVFYIGDSFNHFKPVTKKNIIDQFGKKQNEVQKYLKENKVDFFNGDDLKKMIIQLTQGQGNLK